MRKLIAIASLIVLSVTTGCSSESQSPATTTTTSDAPTAEEVVKLMEPAIRWNFPDPDILFHEGAYFAYATNHNLKNVQIATSTDLVSWEVLSDDAFPKLPSWALPNLTWAPEVSPWPDGSFRLYFTARNAGFPKQCIGVAKSNSPLGPFEAVGDGMLVCPEQLGGAIDATVFFEDQTPYLIWKNDGNCCGIQTDLFIQELSSEGLSLVSDPISLLTTSQDWEGILIEAPTLIKRHNVYHFFYSANDYYSENYAVGHAVSDSLFGPFVKTPGPFLSTGGLDGLVRGPGGQDVIQDQQGDWHIFFHGWNISQSARYMYSLKFGDGVEWPEVP